MLLPQKTAPIDKCATRDENCLAGEDLKNGPHREKCEETRRYSASENPKNNPLQREKNLFSRRGSQKGPSSTVMRESELVNKLGSQGLWSTRTEARTNISAGEDPKECSHRWKPLETNLSSRPGSNMKRAIIVRSKSCMSLWRAWAVLW